MQTTGFEIMSHTIQIDALGMKCPRPIIELAKAKRSHPPGTIIEITADDLAFESDLSAWCETTCNALRELQRDGDIINARVELMEQQ